MDHQFRNAVFGGFNRQDVLDYLETLARENAQKRQELEQSIGRAEGERDELCAQKQALEEQLDQKTERWVYLNDLAERIAAQEK